MANNLGEFATDIHKDAKLFRLIGCLLLVVSIIGAFLLARADDLAWNALTAFLLVFACLGLALLGLGDRLIRKIKKHTGVDVPRL